MSRASFAPPDKPRPQQVDNSGGDHATHAQIHDPVERGNEAASDGTIAQAIDNLVKATNAEAAYFMMIDGERGEMIFFEETDAARLPRINEPLLAALDAAIDIVPVLSLDDLRRGPSA